MPVSSRLDEAWIQKLKLRQRLFPVSEVPSMFQKAVVGGALVNSSLDRTCLNGHWSDLNPSAFVTPPTTRIEKYGASLKSKLPNRSRTCCKWDPLGFDKQDQPVLET